MARPQTRMTRQRMIIMEELSKVTSHPTADEIYAMVRTRLPHISLGTVYRNLDLLAANNQILKLESAGSIRRFDGNLKPHQHVRCIHCGRIGDVFSLASEYMVPVEELHAEGFQIYSARMEFDGICEECAQKMKEEQLSA